MSKESIRIIAAPIFSEESNSFDRLPQVKRTQQILLFLISIVFVSFSCLKEIIYQNVL